ncbi:hypothetical protein HAX54_044684 [Datura stramonium]|uniref:Homeobox-leucine zipper protein n=1 Tax=Datura stramonium TaxID=4076 RepID=A0ABS8WIM4_DATST|nr:hypothetical protein [Datura stramonium]
MTHHHLDDPMSLISHYNPGIYNQLIPPDQGEGKPWRRRKKKKGETKSNTSGVVVRKRKLSEEQVNLLERSFGEEQKLETERKAKLAFELGLDPQQVAVWFQNKRARWKNKKLREEYSKLKSEHKATIIHKCRLETEILKMKEQLCEAGKEIQRLLLLESNFAGISSNINNSIITTNTTSSIFSLMEHPHFLGEQFGMDGILMANNNNNNISFGGDDQNTYI